MKTAMGEDIMLEKIIRYRYALLLSSCAVILAVVLLSVFNSRELSVTVCASGAPEASSYSGESSVERMEGLIDLENFHFSNTRYVKLLPGGSYKIETEREPENANECLIWESSDPSVVNVTDDGTVVGVAPGDARVTAYTFDRKLRRGALVEVAAYPDTILDVPYISQLYYYPNGCESVSTVMALNYVGIDISVDDFIEKYLDMAPVPTLGDDGDLWGYSPWNYFLGDPRDYTGLCCYAPVIKNAVDKFADKNKYEVSELYNVPLETLCRDYVMQGVPVILWGTMYMDYPFEPGWEWNVIDGEDGEVFRWVSPMHCLLLIGFDGENYYFNDPTAGEKVAYRKSEVETAYAGMFSQAVVVRRISLSGN